MRFLHRMTTMETDHQPRQKDDNVDDLLSGSDFIYTNSYIGIQRDLEDFYSLMQSFVIKEEFRRHVKKDGYDLDRIEEKLTLGKNDVMKTECPIVIAGETSAGKSSIINLILGKQILPTDITASTSRVCRIKYSARCSVCTYDKEDKKIDAIPFGNLEEMTEKLKFLAETDIAEISYIDISIPVPLLQGNVMIVDTPGCGDLQQKEVAEMMMSYLPNALAFVFVVNVSNAGGLQDDRLLRILSKVRNSMDKMVSFSPKDVIFLLNKWDTISHVADEKREQFFNKTKDIIKKSWKEVNDSCIFQISAVKVLKKKELYTKRFDEFQRTLKDVITRNENKRVKVHLGYLREFLDEFDRVLSTKLTCAKKNVVDNETKLDELSTKLEKIEETRKEEMSYTERRIDRFINEATTQLQGYIHHTDFKTAVFNNTDKFTRFSIRQELNTRIEKMVNAWLEENIEDIFQKVILEDLLKKFEKIHRALHSIKDNLKGFSTPFDVEKKIASAVGSGLENSRFGFVGYILIRILLSDITVTICIATANVIKDLVVSGLVLVRVIDSFEKIRENSFQASINALSMETLRKHLRRQYCDVTQKVIRAFLEGELEKEIIKMKENIVTLRNGQETFKSEEKTLSALRSTVVENIERLHQIGRIDLTTE